MLKYLLFAVALTIAASFLLIRCANIQAPGGGPKDLKPPQVRKTIPDNETVNYTGNTVEIQFNEDINPLSQELLITPYYGKKVDVKASKNKIKVTFEQLDTNTTYTLNFREQIKDITEKNTLVNYTFTFSTGPHLDSLSLKGSIIDLMTNQPVTGGFISLYKLNDTSTISKDKPYYLTETDKKGSFTIHNVKGGDYRIYALKDANTTINYDNPNDLIDFDTISLKKNISGLVFKVSRIDTTAPKLIHENNIDENTFLIRFSEGIHQFKILYKDTSFTTLLSDDARDLRIYNNKLLPENDSIPFSIYASDSLGNADTSKFKIVFEQAKIKKEKHEDTKKEVNKNEQVINKVLPIDNTFNPDTIDIKIYLVDPWKEINLDSIALYEDSLPVQLTAKDIIKNKELGLFEIKKANKAKDSVLLYLKKTAFITINNHVLFEQKIKYKIKKVEDIGSLSGVVNTEEESYILQLLDSKYTVVQSLKNPKKFQFKYLSPGAYYIRVLIDNNGNGKWDQASLKDNTKAEPIFFYDEKIDLRANWDIEDTVIKF